MESLGSRLAISQVIAQMGVVQKIIWPLDLRAPPSTGTIFGHTKSISCWSQVVTLHSACNHSVYTVCNHWFHSLLGMFSVYNSLVPRLLPTQAPPYSLGMRLCLQYNWVKHYTQYTYFLHFLSYGHPLVPCCPNKRFSMAEGE